MVILGGAVDSNDLSDLLIQIEISIKTANELYGIDLRPRLVTGAIATLERDGFTREYLAGILHERPLKKQWWTLRQHLSPAGIDVLERKTTAFLMTLSHDTTEGNKDEAKISSIL